MPYLAIETSHPRGSLALFDETGLLDGVLFPEGLVHAREIAPQLARLLGRKRLTIKDLRGICVGIGPGSYTGLRVGVTTAKTLAWSCRLPLFGESSLAVLAAGVFHARLLASPDTDPGGLLCVPCLDGRRGTVYWGGYRQTVAGDGERVHRDRVTEVDELLEHVEGPFALVGDGSEPVLARAREICPARLPQIHRVDGELDLPRAGVLANMCLGALTTAVHDPEVTHALEPSYLRPSEPEIRLARRAAEAAGDEVPRSEAEEP